MGIFRSVVQAITNLRKLALIYFHNLIKLAFVPFAFTLAWISISFSSEAMLANVSSIMLNRKEEK